ncbi:MAG: hypothetical protein ABIB97_02565 [Patescibacteria group bacterium]
MVDVAQAGQVATQLISRVPLKLMMGQAANLMGAQGAMETFRGVSSQDIKNYANYAKSAYVTKRTAARERAKERRKKIQNRRNAPLQTGGAAIASASQQEREADEDRQLQEQDLYDRNPQMAKVGPEQQSLVQRTLNRRKAARARKRREATKLKSQTGVKSSLPSQGMIQSSLAGQGQIPSWGDQAGGGGSQAAGTEADAGAAAQDQAEKEEPEKVEEDKQGEARRRLNAFRRLSKAKESGEIGDLKLKDIKKAKEVIKHLQNIYRVINGTSAVSVVGLIITFLVMNAQLILGNGFKIKIVPPLHWSEVGLIGLVDVLLAVLLLLAMLQIAIFGIMIYNILHPEAFIEYMDIILKSGLQGLFDTLKAIFT